jgi:hypothetical protein
LQDSLLSDSIIKDDHAMNPMMALKDEKGSNHDGSGSASSMSVRRHDVDPDNRFVNLVGPQHHQGEDDDEDQE